MFEQSKAAKRRFNDGNFHCRYFVGAGIDIGCGVDSLANYKHVFRGIDTVTPWDLPDGDAQYMEGVPDNTYDFVVSSHCLEHMKDPLLAIQHWIRICRPGGYLIITVPDEEMYEQNIWPSRFNNDHKWSFTNKRYSELDQKYHSINILNFCRNIDDLAVPEKIEMIREFYYENAPVQDQTLHPNIESAIEFILRKV